MLLGCAFVQTLPRRCAIDTALVTVLWDRGLQACMHPLHACRHFWWKDLAAHGNSCKLLCMHARCMSTAILRCKGQARPGGQPVSSARMPP